MRAGRARATEVVGPQSYDWTETSCASKIVVRQTATLWSRGWARTGQETTPATCQELSQVSAQVILLQKSQA